MTATASTVLASDAERADVATRIQAAGGEGRLTLTETEERLTAVYAARHRHELVGLTRDLPPERPSVPPRTGPPRTGPAGTARPLRIHAAVVVLVGTLLIARWVWSGVPFFWPAVPLSWLVAGLVVHAAARGGLDWRRRVVPR